MDKLTPLAKKELPEGNVFELWNKFFSLNINGSTLEFSSTHLWFLCNWPYGLSACEFWRLVCLGKLVYRLCISYSHSSFDVSVR